MFKFKKRRRPIWQPSRFSQTLSFLKSLLKQLTFKRVVVAVVGLPLLLYVVREVMHDALVIDPFSVPKSFEESGLTPEVVSNRIGDTLRRIEAETQTSMKKDNLTSLRDEGAMPEVEIPGTKLGLKTLVDITRAVFGVYPKHLSGDIVAVKNPEASAPQPQLRVTFYITQGRDRSRAAILLVNSNDVDEVARRTAETVLEQVNPYVLACYLEDHSELDRAIMLLRRMVQNESLDREHRSAAFNLWGVVLDDQKNYDKAVEKYKQAIAINPKHAGTYSNWADALSEQGKYDEAIEEYKRAIALNPKDAITYSNWGNTLFKQKKYDEAISKYKQAVALDPKYSHAYNNWGNVLSNQKKYVEAIEKYNQAITLNPENVLAYNNWGATLSEEKKYDEAIDKYKQAIALNPKYSFAYNNWGVALYDQREYDEAIEEYKQAAALDPKYPDAYNNWGLVLYSQKKYDEAIDKYKQAIALNPKFANPYYNWGKVLVIQQKYKEAAEKFVLARRLSQ